MKTHKAFTMMLALLVTGAIAMCMAAPITANATAPNHSLAIVANGTTIDHQVISSQNANEQKTVIGATAPVEANTNAITNSRTNAHNPDNAVNVGAGAGTNVAMNAATTAMPNVGANVWKVATNPYANNIKPTGVVHAATSPF